MVLLTSKHRIERASEPISCSTRLLRSVTLSCLLGMLITGLAPAQDPSALGACSIVARDPLTGDIGVAVRSPRLASGSVVPWAAAASGAIATQGRASASFGPDGLRMLGYGWSAAQSLDSLLAGDPERESRQLAIVDKMGTAAGFTGTASGPSAAHRMGSGYIVLVNGAGGYALLDSMASRYERSAGDLAARLLAALGAGAGSSGKPGADRSAALVVVREGSGFDGSNDRLVDLRVDENRDPVGELGRIYDAWNATAGVESRLAAIDRFNANRQFSAAQEETQRLVAMLNAQLRERPDDPETLNSVAWALSTSGIAKDRALELSTRAVKLAPGDLRYRDTLAECNFRLGRTDEAVRIASEIVAKDPASEYYRTRLQRFLDSRSK